MDRLSNNKYKSLNESIQRALNEEWSELLYLLEGPLDSLGQPQEHNSVNKRGPLLDKNWKKRMELRKELKANKKLSKKLVRWLARMPWLVLLLLTTEADAAEIRWPRRTAHKDFVWQLGPDGEKFFGPLD